MISMDVPNINDAGNVLRETNVTIWLQNRIELWQEIDITNLKKNTFAIRFMDCVNAKNVIFTSNATRV